MTLPLVISPGDLGHIGDHEEIDSLLYDVAVAPFTETARIAIGVFSALPAAGRVGSWYYATDTEVMYFDMGTDWKSLAEMATDLIADVVTNTITGLVVPACRVGKTTDQSIVDDGDLYIVTFDNESGSSHYDNDSIHSISSNTSRLVATRDGYWDFKFSIRWDGNASGTRRLGVKKNGISSSVTWDEKFPNSLATMSQTAVGDVYLLTGDYIQVMAQQTSGGPLDVTSASWASMHFISDA